MEDIFLTFTNWFIYEILSLAKEAPFTKSLHFFVMDIFKIFSLMAIIIFCAGYLRNYLSEEKIKSAVNGKSRIVAYPIAALLGALTPFCSCSSIPLFIGFVHAKIPLDITMVFLITSPMINEIGYFIIGSSIGWEIAHAYALTGISVGMIGGFIIKQLNMEKYLEPINHNSHDHEHAHHEHSHGYIKKKNDTNFTFAFNEMKSIIKRIWLYVIIGIGLGALIYGFVPQEIMQTYLSNENILAVPAAVLSGIPIYANHTGIIPVIEALINKGTAVGTSIAFMMSVSAISLPEMIILRKIFKPQMIITFAVLLFAMFIIVGYIFNILYS